MKINWIHCVLSEKNNLNYKLCSFPVLKVPVITLMCAIRTRADLLVGGVVCVASRVANLRGENTLLAPQPPLSSPETTHTCAKKKTTRRIFEKQHAVAWKGLKRVLNG